MAPNSQVNSLPHHFLTRKLKWEAFLKIVKHPKKSYRRLVRETVLSSKGKVVEVTLASLLSAPPKVILEDFISRDGNLSPFEILSLGALIADRRPMQLVEIGTFDGNSTLQMALNAPKGAKVYTIDLPPGQTMTKAPILSGDLKYIQDEKKQLRKFETKEAEKKIHQHFGDSTAYDFSCFGKVDFAFIDGGHTYECVKSDTEGLLPVLSKNATLLWHDYTPFFPGVFRYLNELSERLPLRHITGTHLCVCIIP